MLEGEYHSMCESYKTAPGFVPSFTHGVDSVSPGLIRIISYVTSLRLSIPVKVTSLSKGRGIQAG